MTKIRYVTRDPSVRHDVDALTPSTRWGSFVPRVGDRVVVRSFPGDTRYTLVVRAVVVVNAEEDEIEVELGGPKENV